MNLTWYQYKIDVNIISVLCDVNPFPSSLLRLRQFLFLRIITYISIPIRSLRRITSTLEIGEYKEDYFTLKYICYRVTSVSYFILLTIALEFVATWNYLLHYYDLEFLYYGSIDTTLTTCFEFILRSHQQVLESKLYDLNMDFYTEPNKRYFMYCTRFKYRMI